MLLVEKESLAKIRNATLVLGVASAACFIVAAAFPPLGAIALGLSALGIITFFVLNRYIAYEKKKTAKAIETKKNQPLDERKDSAVLHIKKARLALTGLSAISIFSKDKRFREKETSEMDERLAWAETNTGEYFKLDEIF